MIFELFWENTIKKLFYFFTHFRMQVRRKAPPEDLCLFKIQLATVPTTPPSSSRRPVRLRRRWDTRRNDRRASRRRPWHACRFVNVYFAAWCRVCSARCTQDLKGCNPHYICLSALFQVLKEIGDMGHTTADLKLVRKPSLPEEEEEEEEVDEDDNKDRTTVSFLKKKKRLLTSFQNSFFSGCTPIREES